MSAISRLQAALATATNEVIVTAANINFDFSLVKCEAPTEYQPLGNMLAPTRKSLAETGSAHITARRLGALFEGACPATPNLIKAYGARISEISAAIQNLGSLDHSASIFSSYAGIDGTSIWAAATSSTVAVHVHLLACMIARIFDAPEAVSIWVELIEGRRRDIAQRFDKGDQLSFSLTAAAAQAPISKTQLAEWDSSARSWLQTADEVKRNEHSQLRALLKDLHLNVNQQTEVFPSVMEAWKSALTTMENLISGQPQAVVDGSTLLALSSWHFYPNLAVFGTHNFEVIMDDHLISPAGVLSIGLSPPKRDGKAGVFWCLSLAHLRHYGKPVRTEGSLEADSTRVTFDQFLLCALGAITSYWKTPSHEIPIAMRFLVAISSCYEDSVHAKWPSIVGRAASAYLSAQGNELEMAKKLVQYGRRRHKDFIPVSGEYFVSTSSSAYFGLARMSTLLDYFKDDEARISFLRSVVSKDSLGPSCGPGDYFIRYHPQYETTEYAGDRRQRGSSSEDRDTTTARRTLPLHNLRHDDIGTDNADSYLTDTDTEDEDEIANDQSCYATLFPGWYGPLCQLSHDAITRRIEDNFATCHHRWVPKRYVTVETPEHEVSHNLDFDIVRRITPTSMMKLRIDSTSTIAVEEYYFRCGSHNTAAIYSRKATTLPVAEQSISNFLSSFDSGFVSKVNLRDFITRFDSPIKRLFQALATAASIYKHLPDATVNIQTLLKPILRSKWFNAVPHEDRQNSKTHRRLFKRNMALCVVTYFESGADLSPSDMDNVFAVSIGDSIYVPIQLMCDPLERQKPRQLKRILGNFGKPGVTLLIPPQQPLMREIDYRRVLSLSTSIFDGKKVDNFGKTSLHLSFTDYQVPVYDTNVKIGQDSQVTVIESVISVYDSGEWIADVNILDAINADYVGRLTTQQPCNHSTHFDSDSQTFSVDSWDDVLDCPEDRFVVRAHGNWLARLAITAVLAQVVVSKEPAQITICQPDVCWKCLFAAQNSAELLVQGFIY